MALRAVFRVQVVRTVAIRADPVRAVPRRALTHRETLLPPRAITVPAGQLLAAPARDQRRNIKSGKTRACKAPTPRNPSRTCSRRVGDLLLSCVIRSGSAPKMACGGLSSAKTSRAHVLREKPTGKTEHALPSSPRITSAGARRVSTGAEAVAPQFRSFARMIAAILLWLSTVRPGSRSSQRARARPVAPAMLRPRNAPS